MDKLQQAEAILESIGIDIEEYFNRTVKKGWKSTKTAVKTNSNGKALECKYCKSKGFEWGETSSGWRLFKKGEEHVCKGEK